MEFPANCLTNVLRIDDFSAVPYSVYELKVRSSLTAPVVEQYSDCLHRLEVLFRHRGVLAAVIYSRRQLWLFGKGARPGESDLAFPKELRPGSSSGKLSLYHVFSGTFRSAALEYKCLPAAAPGDAPNSAPASSVNVDQTRPSKVQNAKAALASRSLSASTGAASTSGSANEAKSSPKETKRARYIYEILMRAIVTTLSYRLTKDHGYLPLNFRTFLNPDSSAAPYFDKSTESLPTSYSKPLFFTTLNVQLTSTGVLLISPTTLQQVGLKPLEVAVSQPEILKDTESEQLACETVSPKLLHSSSPRRECSHEVWLAPGGKIAKLLGLEEDPANVIASPKSSSDPNISLAIRRETARLRLAASYANDDWKKKLTLFLEEGGIDPDSIARSKWVNVEVWVHKRPKKRRTQTLLWPEILCFERRPDPSPNLNGPLLFLDNGTKNPTSWSSLDPLVLAEQWYKGKQERDRLLSKRDPVKHPSQKTVNQDRAIAKSRPAPEGIPVSPGQLLKTSFVNQIDALAASSVYPTPPDALLNPATGGTTHSDATVETPADGGVGTIARSEAVTAHTHNTDLDVDLWDRSQHGALNQEDQADMVDAFGDHPDEAENDLFGEMDDEMFNQPGVTEEDFSFFDEPDDDAAGFSKESARVDIEMEDAFGDGGAHGSTEISTIETQPLKDELDSNHEHQSGTPAVDSNAGSDRMPQACADPAAHVSTIKDEEAPLEQAQISISDSENLLQVGNPESQVPSPPLSPTRILDRLLPHSSESKPSILSPNQASNPSTLSEGNGTTTARNLKNFDPVPFNAALAQTKNKYDTNGRFFFSGTEVERGLGAKKSIGEDVGLPELGLPIKKGRGLEEGRFTAFLRPLQALTKGDHERSSGSGSDFEHSGDGDSNTVSEFDPLDDEMSGMLSQPRHFGGQKRKRHSDDEDEPMLFTLEELAINQSSTLVAAPIFRSVHWADLAPRPTDWPLAGYFDTTRRRNDRLLGLSSKRFINVAQILADQVVLGTLLARKKDGGVDSHLNLEYALSNSDDSLAEFNSAIRDVLPAAAVCSLEEYATIEDDDEDLIESASKTVPSTVALQEPTHEEDEELAECVNITSLPPPHVVIQRGESKLQVLPPAIHFWETFGFGPCSGAKDVTAFCLFPGNTDVAETFDIFLENMGNVYDSCKLGKHVRGNVGNFEDGLVPITTFAIEVEADAPKAAMHIITEACVLLGTMLQALSAKGQNVVIYLINPFVNDDAIVDLCLAFSELFEAYIKSPEVRQSRPITELVLQLIPLDFIYSHDAVITPTRLEYTRLALEVYERCAPTDPDVAKGSTPIRPGPSIALAQQPPTTVDFKLTIEPPISVIYESHSLHVAYSWSPGDRWLSAAWTDGHGHFQTTVSYCLISADFSVKRSFQQVATEIWKYGLELMEQKRVNWRVFLAKSSAMPQGEVDIWVSLANCPKVPSPSKQPSPTLTLLTADLVNPLPLHLGDPEELMAVAASPIPDVDEIPEHFSDTSGGDSSDDDCRKTSTVSPGVPTTLAQMATSPETPLPATPSSPVSPNDPSSHRVGAATSPGSPSQLPATSARMASNQTLPADSPSPSSPDHAAQPTGSTGPSDPVTDALLDTEEDEVFYDATDDVHAIILAHSLPNTNSCVEYRPALASGYLVKRRGVADDDGAVVMGVNLVCVGQAGASSGPQQQSQAQLQPGFDAILLEVLGMYRDLAELTRLKGLADLVGAGSVVPWHVLAADKARRALNALM